MSHVPIEDARDREAKLLAQISKLVQGVYRVKLRITQADIELIYKLAGLKVL